MKIDEKGYMSLFLVVSGTRFYCIGKPIKLILTCTRRLES